MSESVSVNKQKCDWFCDGDMMEKYHDEEWGIPEHDDKKLFEFLMLEAMQCGLSWTIIMKKRQAFFEAFDGWNFEKIANYDENKLEEIKAYPNMLKSMPKIKAAVTNAKAFIQIREEFGSFDNYLWNYTNGKVLVYKSHKDILIAKNELSEKIAKDLKKRGFKYLGAVTVYSFLQACGVINDHQEKCYLYREIIENYETEFLE